MNRPTMQPTGPRGWLGPPPSLPLKISKPIDSWKRASTSRPTGPPGSSTLQRFDASKAASTSRPPAAHVNSAPPYAEKPSIIPEIITKLAVKGAKALGNATIDKLAELGVGVAVPALAGLLVHHEKAASGDDSATKDAAHVAVDSHPQVSETAAIVALPEHHEDHAPPLVPTEEHALHSGPELGEAEAHHEVFHVHLISGKPGHTVMYLAEVRILKVLDAAEGMRHMETFKEWDGTEEEEEETEEVHATKERI